MSEQKLNEYIRSSILLAILVAVAIIVSNCGPIQAIPSIDISTTPESAETHVQGPIVGVDVAVDDEGFSIDRAGDRFQGGVKVICDDNPRTCVRFSNVITGLCIPMPPKVSDVLCAPSSVFKHEGPTCSSEAVECSVSDSYSI